MEIVFAIKIIYLTLVVARNAPPLAKIVQDN